ncbi:hypothetical protein QNI19_15295 [Cytophagaceae bacterium DM2B3-1]|uniref:AraC family transcriptional regulator n=1 Tax=Xanthocytophaga flava TaxID=3048013 RepID=A0ABT7CKT8_9BACT|nr:hypothetical protein [Xanthocytophaga flavus]MDJ1494308.1 hypothetical protein [Xanthocytophaga flavus]
MEALPLHISLAFVIITVLTVFVFYKAAGQSRITLFVILSWLILQMLVSYTGFYTNTEAIPPRSIFFLAPPLLCIFILSITPSGKSFLSQLDIKTLTLLHSIRIPVELVLFWLFSYKVIPEVMTFEGRNLDILSGLSAPFIYYFGFVRQQLNRTVLLVWNILCLVLLLNVVIHAILSFPYPFQQFGFDQPNIAVLHFPFVWLPSCVVPLVLLSHIASIRQLLYPINSSTLT